MSTTTSTSAATATVLEQEWRRWHAARELELVAEYGWLSLRAFGWLGDEPAVVADLPGRWSASDGDAVLHAGVGDGLTVDGRLVDGRVTAHLPEGGSLPWVRHGRRLVELVRRAGRYAVRLRDPDAPARTGFRGVPAYPVDERWVVTGRVTRLPEPEPVEVATARADLRQVVTVVATVDLDVEGTTYRLRATDAGEGRLALAFHDDTNGHGIARWRTVVTDPVADDGPTALVRVDLNRAVNPPFAFSDHGTCPAPPYGNRLALPVTAGERAPAPPGEPRADGRVGRLLPWGTAPSPTTWRCCAPSSRCCASPPASTSSRSACRSGWPARGCGGAVPTTASSRSPPRVS